jgi:hypothetical protein
MTVNLKLIHIQLSDILNQINSLVGPNYTLTLIARCHNVDIKDADIIMTAEIDLELPQESLRRFKELKYEIQEL